MTGCKKGRAMSVGGWREPHSDSDSSADGEDEEDGKLKELVSNLCFPLGGDVGGGGGGGRSCVPGGERC